jgi:hypothetical protein
MGATRDARTGTGLTLDAGALIAIERGDRAITSLLRKAVKSRVRISVPAGVVGQAWRDGSRQVRLSRLLRSRNVQVPPLDEQLARAAGALCGRRGTSDVIDASVVLTARAGPDTILTSDPEDLVRLDPRATIERV